MANDSRFLSGTAIAHLQRPSALLGLVVVVVVTGLIWAVAELAAAAEVVMGVFLTPLAVSPFS